MLLSHIFWEKTALIVLWWKRDRASSVSHGIGDIARKIGQHCIYHDRHVMRDWQVAIEHASVVGCNPYATITAKFANSCPGTRALPEKFTPQKKHYG